MRKNILGAAVLAAMLVSGVFGACSSSPKETMAAVAKTQTVDSRTKDTTAVETGTTQASAELKEIVVGASPAPHAEILNAAKEVLASKGYELKIIEYVGYVQPNNALDSGDLDASYLQHKPYLDSFNEQNRTNLVSTSAIHYKSFGIYAGKTAFPEELSDKVTVLVLSDVSNEVGALLLLEAQGLIKLKDGVGLEATKNDIVENTKNLDVTGLEAVQFPHSVSDGDIMIVNGNYVIETGFEVSNALVTKDSQFLAAAIYGNVVAAREGEESSDAIKALMEASTSPEVKQFIEETYKGAVVPLFQHVFAGSSQSDSFKIKHSYS